MCIHTLPLAVSHLFTSALVLHKLFIGDGLNKKTCNQAINTHYSARVRHNVVDFTAKRGSKISCSYPLLAGNGKADLDITSIPILLLVSAVVYTLQRLLALLEHAELGQLHVRGLHKPSNEIPFKHNALPGRDQSS